MGAVRGSGKADYREQRKKNSFCRVEALGPLKGMYIRENINVMEDKRI